MGYEPKQAEICNLGIMKKFLRGFLYTILTILALFSLFAVVTGRTYLFKAVWYNFADIDDYKVFDNNTVTTGQPQAWNISANYNTATVPAKLKQLLDELSSVAVVVIKNDSLLFEQYWQGYSDSSLSASFSVAKSITSLLIGCALKDGNIKSLEEPVGTYIPAFKQGEKAKVRIVDLLTMSSGSDWDESYANPLSVTTELYYGGDVYKTATGVKIIDPPGTVHLYKSGDTQLLGLIVEKATGKSLSVYATEKLWKPLGAQHPALWSTDQTGGHEKAYCCFNSNARDFAKIGQLMLDSGRWKGAEIIPADYYLKSVSPCGLPDRYGNACDYYGYQWWIVPRSDGIFYARGILGQYIVVMPEQRMVIVRLGKKRSSRPVNGAPEEVDALIQWGKNL
jgi:CubicO group peptidase (beta-lactamase class C family)